MTPLLGLLVLAATADLSVALDAPHTADAQAGFMFRATVTNHGPNAAIAQVRTGAAPMQAMQCYGGTEFNLGPQQQGSVLCVVSTLQQTGDVAVGVSVTSDASDPNPADNSAGAIVRTILGPNLGTGVFAYPYVRDPALPLDVTAQYWNTSTLTATNVVMTIDIPPGFTVQSMPPMCIQSGARIVCSLGDVPGGSSAYDPPSIHITLVAPDRREGVTEMLHAAIAANEPEGMLENNAYTSTLYLFRTFVVENTNDSGSGSLRSAIETANASCGDGFPCKVAFRIPASGVVTIQPRSPLPLMTAPVLDVDGTTQNARIFLDGSALTDGDGLVISCRGSVRGLAIGNFPGSGVRVAVGGPCAKEVAYLDHRITGNYIGLDATGSNAAPNTRGIVIEKPYTVSENVISANRRSGISVVGGYRSFISNNIIGLDPTHRFDFGNGASGIYLSPRSADTEISGNYIAFNHDFGIGVDTGDYVIHPNSIFANWQMGIDKGLDGPTPSAPVITSASYDPASETTIIVVSGAPNFEILDFYASDAPHRTGYGDGQYYLGTARHSDGRFAAKGDWRGKWVSVTLTHDGGSEAASFTSEFSRAVEVR